MAVVTYVERDAKGFRGRHPTALVCRHLVGHDGGGRVLQLNSYGSEGRDYPDKLSQTLQFDENSAKQLYDVLKEQFGF